MIALKHIANTAMPFYGTAGGLQQAGQNIQNGALSAAGRAQHGGYFTLLQLHADVIQHGQHTILIKKMHGNML